MKIKFNNNVEKECTNPIEQKLFKNAEPVGWICSFNLKENTPSAEIDTLVIPENISVLEFLNDEGDILFSLTGYQKITAVVVRHAETEGSVEIQLTKGV